MLPLVNQDRTPTQYGVSTLDEVLEHLKNRCFINIDKLETDVAGIARTVRRHHMLDQVIAKTWAEEPLFKEVEAVAPDLPYMVMMREKDEYTPMLRKMNLNYLGSEVMFSSESSELATRAYVDSMHVLGLYVWCNAIVFNYKVIFAAGHADEVSATGRPEDGWGWLASRGYDMMQTDWAGAAVRYLRDAGLKTR